MSQNLLPRHNLSTPSPTHAGKAKIDTFNKSKEKNVACREFNPKKAAKSWQGKEEESSKNGRTTKFAGGNPPGQQDESQVSAGKLEKSRGNWAEGG
ncbi:hypothetical protein M5D96_006339 [Drosophila gunungcola]|uniref:Uncharacterized protein n=1 Tax=Drosophila gunungcola TaxID=103775 RepID=A0A9P9YNT7_9MUSC|nr:hypothetical protein M5D96_006339 [Drosophila gunungcola]